MVNRIRDHGLYNSQVMDTLQYLSDVIGPRLSGSPQLKEANDWTMNIDSFDHVVEDDVIQASTILAHFLYQAAMLDERLPREPIPTGPSQRQIEKAEKDTARARRNRQRNANRSLDTNPD